MPRARLRDLGIVTGTLTPGPWNALTDVSGLRVGYTTLVRDQPSIIRTGVTAIWPRGPEIWTDAVFAGIHSFNGNGEMTGWAWIAEQGLLAAPICITNTYSVGIVRDADLCAGGARQCAATLAAAGGRGDLRRLAQRRPQLPGHRRARDRRARWRCVRAAGGGQCRRRHRHDLPRVQGRHRHGIACRAGRREDRYTVGALVQANYGAANCCASTACRWGARSVSTVCLRRACCHAGSIIVVLATDAPLLPIQCQRLARRATTGLAWVGGVGFNGSGDIFLAFATGNHVRAGRGDQHAAHAVARQHEPAVPGRGRSNRGSHPQRPDVSRDDDRSRWPHGARAAARPADGR